MKKVTIFFFIVLLFAQCSATTAKRSTGETIDDSVIMTKLRAKYINDKTVKSGQVKVKSWKGVVTLSGVLDTQTAINRAIEIAEQQNGVKEVKAYLVLKDSGQAQNPLSPTTTSDVVITSTTAPAEQAVAPEKKSTKTTKKTTKKSKDRDVIETDLMDNSVTTPLKDTPATDPNSPSNVDSTSGPLIESTTDYEEVKY